MKLFVSAEGLLPLDGTDPRSTDPAIVGAKAAALAVARRAGLPVLPGYVVPVSCSRASVDAAVTAVTRRGPGAARRAALAVTVPAELARALSTVVDALGGRVIVRSSSPLEEDHRWSGAFTSVSEVGPGDIVTAVRSCWASAFAPDPMERAERCGVPLTDLGLGVLIQPELRPTAGGLARTAGGTTTVTAVPGHPGALLGGWVTGETATIHNGRSAISFLDDRATAGIGVLAHEVATALSHDTIEWAAVGADVTLLQSTVSALRVPERIDLEERPGRRVSGRTAVEGDAVGRLHYVRPHEVMRTGELSLTDGVILVCERPVPALAPLLFGARGLVSLSGPVQCHLTEVARSLGVPVLVDTPVPDLTGPLDRLSAAGPLAAIDGGRAELVVLTDDPSPPRDRCT